MANLQNDIAEVFLEQLKKSPDVTPEMVEALHDLLFATKKLKVDDLVKVFAPPESGDME